MMSSSPSHREGPGTEVGVDIIKRKTVDVVGLQNISYNGHFGSFYIFDRYDFVHLRHEILHVHCH